MSQNEYREVSEKFHMSYIKKSQNELYREVSKDHTEKSTNELYRELSKWIISWSLHIAKSNCSMSTSQVIGDSTEFTRYHNLTVSCQDKWRYKFKLLREHILEHLLWFVVHGQMAILQLNLERKKWRQTAKEKEKDKVVKKDVVVLTVQCTYFGKRKSSRQQCQLHFRGYNCKW